MIKEFVFAGFGGQGVLTSGMILATAGAINDMEVTWIPSYGSEMRGGTANCTVKLGNEEIPSPFAKHIDTLVAMNEVSLHRFAPMVKKGSGLIIVNSSIVHDIPVYEGVRVLNAPVNEISAGLGNERGSNVCVLGFVAAATGIFTREALLEGIQHYFAQKGKATPANAAVFNAGFEYAEKELA